MPQIIIKQSNGEVAIGPFKGDASEVVSLWEKAHASEGVTAISFRTSPTPVVRPGTGRIFRKAWTDDLPGLQIDVDMPKARVIHMDRIRHTRNEELDMADKDLARAEDDNNGSETARLKSKRKTLRDLPESFDLSGATNPEELDALWPSELPDRG